MVVGIVIGAVPLTAYVAWLDYADGQLKDRAMLHVPRILEEQQSAWNAGDLERFMDYYADNLTFFTGGDELKGRDALTARYRKRYQTDGKEMGELTFTDLDVTPLSPIAAVVRGRWKVQMKDGKAPEGLFTLLVKRTPDGWKIAHDHTSAAEPPKSP
jgi:beta-aspartyl-peptidase (threonine type)